MDCNRVPYESGAYKVQRSTRVQITGTSYTCPCDGYIWAYLGASGNYIDFHINNEINCHLFRSGNEWTIFPIFVKRGMIIDAITYGGGLLFFYPIEGQ